MTYTKKGPAPAGTGGEAQDMRSGVHNITANTDIALRGALWAVIRNSHPKPIPFGFLVARAQGQGFTAAQARRELQTLAENGAIEFTHADEGRIVVCICGQGGRGE